LAEVNAKLFVVWYEKPCLRNINQEITKRKKHDNYLTGTSFENKLTRRLLEVVLCGSTLTLFN